eukprot:1962199-Rhodomonas_salina.3
MRLLSPSVLHLLIVKCCLLHPCSHQLQDKGLAAGIFHHLQVSLITFLNHFKVIIIPEFQGWPLLTGWVTPREVLLVKVVKKGSFGDVDTWPAALQHGCVTSLALACVDLGPTTEQLEKATLKLLAIVLLKGRPQASHALEHSAEHHAGRPELSWLVGMDQVGPGASLDSAESDLPLNPPVELMLHVLPEDFRALTASTAGLDDEQAKAAVVE